MLIQELKELQQDSLLKYTNYPSLVTSQILSDWVFTQYPILLKEVVKIIIKGINIGNIINQNSRYSLGEAISLPNECGRKEIFNECFEQLKNLPKSDYAHELIAIINNNPLDINKLWQNEVNRYSKDDLVKWLKYAYLLQIIHKIDENLLESIVLRDSLNFQKEKVKILVRGNRLDVIEKNKDLKETLVDSILNDGSYIISRRKLKTGTQFLWMLLNPFSFSLVFRSDHSNIPFINLLTQRFDRLHQEEYINYKIEINDDIDRKIKSLLEDILPILNTLGNSWEKRIDNWDIFVEKVKNYFGEGWTLKTIAIIGSEIKSKDEKYEEYSDIGDNSISLCKRTRCARLKSGNVSYWENQFSSNNELIFKTIIFFNWATPKTIINTYKTVERILNKISNDEKQIVVRTLNRTIHMSIFSLKQSKEIINFFIKKKVSHLFKYIVSLRFSENIKREFIYSHIKPSLDPFAENINLFKFEHLLKLYLTTDNNDKVLSDIKKYYSRIDYIPGRRYMDRSRKIPIEEAKNIMSNAKAYPRVIASIAEMTCRHYANTRITPVGKIANDEKWFD